MLAAGPWLRFYDPSVHITPDRLSLADHLIGVIVDEGVPMSLAVRAVTLVTQIVQQSILDHLRLPWGDVDDGGPVLDGLDPEEYPSLAAARVAFAEDSNGEAQYRFSCDARWPGSRRRSDPTIERSYLAQALTVVATPAGSIGL